MGGAVKLDIEYHITDRRKKVYCYIAQESEYCLQ